MRYILCCLETREAGRETPYTWIYSRIDSCIRGSSVAKGDLGTTIKLWIKIKKGKRKSQ